MITKPDAPEKNPGKKPNVDNQALLDLWNYNFSDHKLTTDGKRKIRIMRNTAKTMAEAIIKTCPPGRDQALALTSLEQMLFHANAAIARTENEVAMGTPEEDKALEEKDNG